MGYGSLIVESSADQPLKFRNVASLSKVQAQLNQLIRDEREATHHRRDEPSGYQQSSPPQGLAPQQIPAGTAPSRIRRRATRRRVDTRSSRTTRRRLIRRPTRSPVTSPPRPTSSRPDTRRPATQAAYPQQAAPSNTSTPPAAPPAPPGGSGARARVAPRRSLDREPAPRRHCRHRRTGSRWSAPAAPRSITRRTPPRASCSPGTGSRRLVDDGSFVEDGLFANALADGPARGRGRHRSGDGRRPTASA